MKFRKIYLLPIILGLGVVAGPRPSYDMEYQPGLKVSPKTERTIPTTLEEIEPYLAFQNNAVEDVKSIAHAKVYWADSSRQKTQYALVYLHGFSAGPMEGEPLHYNLANYYGWNLYTPRLADHGRDSKESFKELTPQWYLETAQEALAIGRLLGDKLIVMGCSMGGALSLYLASKPEEQVKGLMLYAPCVALAHPAAGLATGPWGRQLMNVVEGEYRTVQYPPGEGYAWTPTYHTNGIITIQSFMDKAMTPKTFNNIKVPTMVAYYYKDADHQDPIVSVAAIQDMVQQLGTPKEQVSDHPLPDLDAHVIMHPMKSANPDTVWAVTRNFVEKTWGWQAVLDDEPQMVLADK